MAGFNHWRQKAILQELKYTFTKAEKAKRDAVRSPDPKAVFKAMRPVFNQFSAELQRHIGGEAKGIARPSNQHGDAGMRQPRQPVPTLFDFAHSISVESNRNRHMSD